MQATATSAAPSAAAATVQSTKKPRLSFWQIWNMSFGFLGIQFGFALQNANVSRIFQTLGASIDDLPLLWIAAPMTGFLVQPIIGYFSDHTWGRFGRRKPYFLVGAILASLAIVAMPNAPALWIAAGLLWVMDSSINVSMEPFRAFVGDVLPEEQLTQGFSVQSFFIGAGAVVASALPYVFSNWFHVANTAAPGRIPHSVEYAFYVGAAAFFLAVAWTVITSKEYSPEQMRLYGLQAIEQSAGASFFRNLAADIWNMPKAMARLALVQFFTWVALFAMWIYTTPVVTRVVYHTSDPSSAAFNEGANWVGVCFSAYSACAAIFAFLLPLLANRIGLKTTHALCLAVGGVSLLSIYTIGEPNLLILPMVGIGLAWASIVSLPYAMLASALPPAKMGVYMGIFNIFIVLPQIAVSLFGWAVKQVFATDATFTLALGGCSMFVAAALVLFVHDHRQE